MIHARGDDSSFLVPQPPLTPKLVAFIKCGTAGVEFPRLKARNWKKEQKMRGLGWEGGVMSEVNLPELFGLHEWLWLKALKTNSLKLPFSATLTLQFNSALLIWRQITTPVASMRFIL